MPILTDRHTQQDPSSVPDPAPFVLDRFLLADPSEIPPFKFQSIPELPSFNRDATSIPEFDDGEHFQKLREKEAKLGAAKAHKEILLRRIEIQATRIVEQTELLRQKTARYSQLLRKLHWHAENRSNKPLGQYYEKLKRRQLIRERLAVLLRARKLEKLQHGKMLVDRLKRRQQRH